MAVAVDEAAADEQADILLVEDDASYQQLAIHALRSAARMPLKIRSAADGEAAIEALVDERAPSRPRLVILDLKLPKLSGFEVLRRVRANPATRHVPIVVLSSSQLPQDIVRSLDLGANSYVVRPLKFQDYARTLSAVVDYWLTVHTPPESN